MHIVLFTVSYMHSIYMCTSCWRCHAVVNRGSKHLQAAEQPKGSIERLLLVAAFSVSPYSNCLRAQRSFNPVHGGEAFWYF